jgi:hypothetical protein
MATQHYDEIVLDDLNTSVRDTLRPKVKGSINAPTPGKQGPPIGPPITPGPSRLGEAALVGCHPDPPPATKTKINHGRQRRASRPARGSRVARQSKSMDHVAVGPDRDSNNELKTWWEITFGTFDGILGRLNNVFILVSGILMLYLAFKGLWYTQHSYENDLEPVPPALPGILQVQMCLDFWSHPVSEVPSMKRPQV